MPGQISTCSSDAQADSQGRFELMEAVGSLSKSLHRLSSAQLEVQRRLGGMEAAQSNGISAVNAMTTMLRTDLQAMQRQSCQETCDFIGGQFQAIRQGFTPAQEATVGGFQSPTNLSQDGLESLRTFIQQEFQSLKASLGSAAHVPSEDAAANALDEAPQSVEELVDGKGAVKSDRVALDASGDEWEDFQEAVTGYEDRHNAYLRITTRVKEEQHSLWHRLFRHFGLLHLLHVECPRDSLAYIAESNLFTACQTVLILSNTVLLAYGADASMKAALQEPKGETPAWLSTCDHIFMVVFTIELLFRIAALRTWFFVSPEDWGWNLFDVCVVASSAATDLMGGANLSFTRTFRILRAVRAVRVIRVLRLFRELRKILLSILACLSSLAWCFLFLAMTMLMFSIMALQGIAEALDAMDPSSEEHEIAHKLARTWYGSLGDAMFTLLAVFTTGDDFFTFHEPIKPAGFLYSAAYVIYLLFVIIGVMNVLTGVFLSASTQFVDRSLIVQGEQMEQENFVMDMIGIFEECDLDRNGQLLWEEFNEALKDENLQTFMAAHRVDVTHARLIFDILDEQECGRVNLMEFVMGMLRLKGEAKAIDARIIQRELGMIPKMLNPMLLNTSFKSRKAHHAIQSKVRRLTTGIDNGRIEIT